MLALTAGRKPDFWSDPVAWVRSDLYGSEALFAGLVVIITGGLIVAFVQRARRIAQHRATTPNGPDADYREPA